MRLGKFRSGSIQPVGKKRFARAAPMDRRDPQLGSHPVPFLVGDILSTQPLIPIWFIEFLVLGMFSLVVFGLGGSTPLKVEGLLQI